MRLRTSLSLALNIHEPLRHGVPLRRLSSRPRAAIKLCQRHKSLRKILVRHELPRFVWANLVPDEHVIGIVPFVPQLPQLLWVQLPVFRRVFKEQRTRRLIGDDARCEVAHHLVPERHAQLPQRLLPSVVLVVDGFVILLIRRLVV